MVSRIQGLRAAGLKPSKVNEKSRGIKGLRGRLLGSTAIVAVAAVALALQGAAQAQTYTWGGTGSSTTTADYNLGTNWSNPPAGAPPVNAGQSAQFDATGSATVTVSAGPITPDSWTFTATSQSYTVSGQAVNFGGTGLTNNANAGQAISVSNSLGGAGGVTQNGASTLTLSGSNSYSGGTSVQAGTLVASSTGALGSTTSNTSVSGGTLDLGAVAHTQAQLLQSGGTVQNGTMNVTTYQLTGGTLSAGATVNATTAFDMQAGTVSGVLGGAGALTKTTAGTVTLSGTNTYSGGTSVQAGTLVASSTGALGSTAATTSVSGGTLDLGAVAHTQAQLLQSGGTVQNGTMNVTTYQLTGGTLAAGATVNASTAFDMQAGTVNGVLGGAGTLTKTTAGTVTLSGTNTYSGGTSVQAGTLVASSTGALGSTAATTSVSGGTLDLGGVAHTQAQLLQSGGIVQNGTMNVTTYQLTGGVLDLGATVNATTAFDMQAGNVNGGLGGAGTLTKTTAGTVQLSGANTYTGATNIANGILALSLTSSIATSSQVNLTNAAGIFDISQTTFGTSIVTLNGVAGSHVDLGSKTLTVTNGSTTYAGIIQDGGLSGGTGGKFSVTGGTQTLTGVNTYTGATTIGAATLALANGGSIASSSQVNLTNAASIFDISQTTAGASIVTLNGIAGSHVDLGSQTLTVTNGSTTYAGIIQDGGLGGGTLGKLQVTGGTLTLSGNNTFTGGTTITAAGNIINNGSLSTTGGVSNAGGYTNNGTTGGVGNTGTFTNTGGAGAVTNSGTATNSGTIASLVNSGGTFTSAAGGVITGTASNSASFVVTGNSSVGGTYTNATAGSTLAVNTGTFTVTGLVTNSGAITVSVPATLTATAGGITNTATGTINNFGIINDALDNFGVVVNNAGATYNANATNEASGTITNNGTWNGTLSNTGIVNIGNGSTWNAGAGNFANNVGGTVNATGTSTITAAGLINNGTINLAGGSGSTIVNATSAVYSGNGAINAGVVSLSSATGANQVVVANTSGNVVLSGTATGGGFVGFIPVLRSLNPAGTVTASGSTLSTGFYQAQVATQNGSAGYNVSAAPGPAVAPLTSILSTLSAIDASFHQPGGNLVASPQTDKPCTSFTPMTGNDKTCQVVGGPWARVSSGVTTVSSTGTELVPGTSVFNQVFTKQRVQFTGVQAGADSGWLNLGGNGVNAHFGITGGEVEANATELVATTNSVNFNVPFMGVYYLVTKGAFSTDFTYRHSWYDMRVTNPIAQLNNTLFHGQSDNVNGSVSYTVALPKNFFIEPTANLSYTRSNFDNLPLGGNLGVLGFNDVKSLLGRAGARVGTGFQYGGFNWSPFGIALVQHEFAGNASGTFTGSSGGLANIDSTRVGTFYQTSLGLSFQSQTNGLLGFVRGDWRFGDNLHGGGVLGGVRYTFGP